VLKREPRHFGALMAMGVIAEGQGQTAAALEAYRTALRHHPYLEGARAGVARLAPKIDGRDT
jgi:Tfp pilus assembly protein PilF